MDERIKTLAKNLINYSVAAKKGDKVLIEAFETGPDIVTALVNEAYAVGAYPYVVLRDNRVHRAILSGADETYFENWKKYDIYRMNDMDCYIGVRGTYNSYETSDVPGDKTDMYSRLYSHPVHHETRVCKTRWVVLRFPNDSMAQLAGKPTEVFEDYYFDVCNLDYSRMDRAMDALKSLMDRTDKVRLVAKDTDLTFSIKGIGSVKCSGHMNIPDGEVYSAPVKDSVNGVITYNAVDRERHQVRERAAHLQGRENRRPDVQFPRQERQDFRYRRGIPLCRRVRHRRQPVYHRTDGRYPLRREDFRLHPLHARLLL